jgi:release factor glutamine methyltransferase
MSDRPAAAEETRDREAWTIRKVLTWTTQHFERRGVDAPRLTGEILLAHSLAIGRVQLYIDLDRPLNKAELGAYRALIERRLTGEPTQYLTGYREFYNRRFAVDPRVLIPRPETELLVEAVLRHLPAGEEVRVLDLCTGSGCVGVSVAAERETAAVLATDLSEDACAVAAKNAAGLQVGARVRVVQGDLFAAVPAGERFHAVASNPPYIRTAELPTLQVEVQREPKTALDGGADGLAFIRRIVTGAPAYLVPGGLLALEIGDEQGPAVVQLLREAGYGDARIEKDLARLDRLALGTRPAAD